MNTFEVNNKNSKVTIVMYHYVRNLKESRYPNIKGLDYKLFKEQIEFICQNYNVITMEDVIQSSFGEINLPEKALLLTFDDGYIDHYLNVYPMLKEYGVQGSFFMSAKTLAESKVLDVNKIHFILANKDINILVKDVFHYLDEYREKGYQIESNEILFDKLAIANRFDCKETIFVKRLFQNELDEGLRNKLVQRLFEENIEVDESIFSKELYMNMDQIKCMKKDGMYFGIHGYDHYWLGKLENEKMKEDINKALRFFDGIIDKNNWVMNYPYGSFNDEVINYIKTIGCKLGISTEVDIATINKESLYNLPRLDTNDLPPKSNNYLNY